MATLFVMFFGFFCLLFLHTTTDSLRLDQSQQNSQVAPFTQEVSSSTHGSQDITHMSLGSNVTFQDTNNTPRRSDRASKK